MKKPNSLNSTIKKYTALASGVTAAATASAQVMYTDINPDAVISAVGPDTIYGLNLDGDGVTDMQFGVIAGSGTGIYTYGTMQIPVPYTVSYAGAMVGFSDSAATANGWMGTSSGITAVPMNNLVGSSGNFVQTNALLGLYQSTYLGTPINGSYGPYTTGAFVGSEGYIGVRFDIAGATHYGWARVEVSADCESMTIKDYAYNATAGTAIAAGDIGSVDIDELGMDNLIHFINNQNNRVIVKHNGITNGTINVVSTSGQVVSNIKVNNQTEVVDLNELASGIYVINVTATEGFLSKKVYVR